MDMEQLKKANRSAIKLKKMEDKKLLIKNYELKINHVKSTLVNLCKNDQISHKCIQEVFPLEDLMECQNKEIEKTKINFLNSTLEVNGATETHSEENNLCVESVSDIDEEITYESDGTESEGSEESSFCVESDSDTDDDMKDNNMKDNDLTDDMTDEELSAPITRTTRNRKYQNGEWCCNFKNYVPFSNQTSSKNDIGTNDGKTAHNIDSTIHNLMEMTNKMTKKIINLCKEDILSLKIIQTLFPIEDLFKSSNEGNIKSGQIINKSRLNVEDSINRYCCSLCIHVSESITSFQQHLKLHSLTLHFNQPPALFPSKRSSDIDKENKKSEKVFKCDDCDKVFEEYLLLRKHKQTHEERQLHKCDMCDFASTTLNYLQKHKRCHDGEKPFVCDICNTSFSQLTYLQRHQFCHTGKRPFQCDICQMLFTRNDSLKAHLSRHSKKKPFKCDLCDSSFSRQSKLKEHQRKHKKEKRHKCDICDISFNRESYLRRHQRIHTSEKPFECQHCDKTFSLEVYLKKHERTHTAKKEFKCNICGSLFSRKDSLVTHKRNH